MNANGDFLHIPTNIHSNTVSFVFVVTTAHHGRFFFIGKIYATNQNPLQEAIHAHAKSAYPNECCGLYHRWAVLP